MVNKNSTFTCTLYTSRSRPNYAKDIEDFRALVDDLNDVAPIGKNFIAKVIPEIVDIEKNPEIAEKKNIKALPTLEINSNRFIGISNLEKILKSLQ